MNSFTDLKEREAYINKILRHYHDEAFFLPLWANDTLFVASKSVELNVAPYMAYSVLDRTIKTS
jgi:hypothetical protein